MHILTEDLMQAETVDLVLDGEPVKAGILRNFPFPAALVIDRNGTSWVALADRVIRQVRAQSIGLSR